MPQAMTYKANSVIFFRGDASKKIYILQSGRVILKREDIESGQEVQESIQTGEFFGVKSALGKYSRDEDAIVVTDSQVLMFNVQEFEQLVTQNTRIGIKMLKVFSNQLRKIHAKVRALMATDEQRTPEEGLYHNAEYYLKKKKYAESIYILRKYIKYYPNAKNIAEAKKFLQLAEDYSQKYGSNNGPAIISDDRGGPPRAAPAAPKKPGSSVSDPKEKMFYEAVSLSGRGEFKGSIELLKKLEGDDPGPELLGKIQFELGRSIFGLKQYDACIKHFGLLIKQNPELPDMPDALFFVGQSYEKMGDKGKAGSVFERILQIKDLEEDTRRKVKQAIKAMGG